MTPPVWTADRRWPGETVVIVAGGPSLRTMDLSCLRVPSGDRPSVIVVNTSYRLMTNAEVLYFCDYKWFVEHRQAVTAWPGLAVTLAIKAAQECPTVRWLRQGDVSGLADDRSVLNTGRNSGYQAIGLAVHFGARRIVLVGFDMAPGPDGACHWHAPHQGRPQGPGHWRQIMLPHFPSLLAPLQERGVTVVNATPGSALDVFPHVTLGDEIALWRRQKTDAGRQATEAAA